MRSHGYSSGNWSTHNAYHSDANGNVTALISSAGVLQASYKYNPYGGLISSSGTLGRREHDALQQQAGDLLDHGVVGLLLLRVSVL
jgi:hypothetical protein